MASKGLRLGMTTLAIFVLAGCGGGSPKSINPDKAIVRKRILATTRLAQEAFAVAGLVRHVTRAVPRTPGPPVPRLLFLLVRQRSDPQGIDAATGLYYTLSFNGDGSGQQNLFTDSTYHTPAGNFTWATPVWSGNTPNTYPALLHVTFQITAGNFAGDHGTLDVTANDATGNNDLIDIAFTNAQGEKFVGHFKVVNGVISAQAAETLADGTACNVVDDTAANGDIICTTTFPDDSQTTSTTTPDGSGDQTYTDSSGEIDASGDFQWDGSDTITYDDGSSETVDLDTDSE